MTNRTSRSSTDSRETAPPRGGGGGGGAPRPKQAGGRRGGGGRAPIWTNTQAGMTIRRLRLIALLGFLLLVAASVAVTFAALQRQRDDALIINMAGRQRMLIQTMMLEVLGVQADSD